jgi:hypothetical protein
MSVDDRHTQKTPNEPSPKPSTNSERNLSPAEQELLRMTGASSVEEARELTLGLG